MSVTVTFLGAAGTVTGSKYLVSFEDTTILVDCGMFQGERSWREKNWSPPPLDLSKVNAVLLTHAHVDHIGMLPRYFKLGLRCPVFCSSSTADLGRLILLDSARLQEEETLYRLEGGRSRHHPPLPLYTEADAQGAIELFRTIQLNHQERIADDVTASWSLMGHILGACSITLRIGGKTLVFSGDIGRYSVPILVDPVGIPLGDLLLIESTYGDRSHSEIDPSKPLAEIINRTVKRRGAVLIPSFAVGRTQTLLFYLRELKSSGAIPDIPVIIDSPMAGDATEIYRKHPSEYDEHSIGLLKKGHHPFTVSRTRFVQERYESMKLNSIKEPMIIISASGMLSGGRVLHHLKHRVSEERNTVLFVGFQPPGSRGDWLKRGSGSIRIMGDEVPVRAEIAEISGLSAHADQGELLRWCRSCSGVPGKVAVVHGEPESAAHFRDTLEREMKWNAVVPHYLERLEV